METWRSRLRPDVVKGGLRAALFLETMKKRITFNIAFTPASWPQHWMPDYIYPWMNQEKMKFHDLSDELVGALGGLHFTTMRDIRTELFTRWPDPLIDKDLT